MEPSQIPVEALQGVYTAFAYVTTGSVSALPHIHGYKVHVHPTYLRRLGAY